MSSNYGPIFQPEEIERLSTAYELAWRELCASILTRRPEIEKLLARETVAQRIIASASTCGTQDVNRLKEQALRSWWRLRSTPFKAYAPFFGADELDAMTVAYERAWHQIWATDIVLAPAECARLKRQIAQVILAATCTGKRQIEPLTSAALRAVSRTKLRLEADTHMPGPVPALI